MATKSEHLQDGEDAGRRTLNMRWFVRGFDILLFASFFAVGTALLTGTLDGMHFRTISNEFFGLLLMVQGFWSLYAAVRLTLDGDSLWRQPGAHRHRISAQMNVALILFLWLAVFLDSVTYSPHVFEMGFGVVLFATVLFGIVAGLLFVISWRMKNTIRVDE